MFDDTYKTIESPSEGLYKEKGSKFIAFAIPATTEEEIKEHIAQIKKNHHDARHHCYAYILGHNKSAYRINDDGEPSGTAGKPIHGQLLSKDLTNTLVIVVRYFGGTKLGVSGLITAYKEATRDALDNAKIIEKTVNDIYRIEFEYPLMNNVMKVLKDESIEQFNQRFEMDCSLEISIRTSMSNRICDIFNKMPGITISYLRTV
ncbi:YigZ family protein [Bacteroidales bacterium OttesenSCG-928-C19]|nr:YigZ family protein [Bacteroidales bacterium OttesenSCG-928-C19]